MHATLQMLRDVARRGRKRWLSLAFVSQQPGHLPPEIFELCNTRIVHTLRSMHNLDVLMSTAGPSCCTFCSSCCRWNNSARRAPPLSSSCRIVSLMSLNSWAICAF